jgi:hypothetical protein
MRRATLAALRWRPFGSRTGAPSGPQSIGGVPLFPKAYSLMGKILPLMYAEDLLRIFWTGC